MERLDKILVSQGICTRSEARELVRRGRVALNGRTIADPGAKASNADRITLDGRDVFQNLFSYIMLHKPLGVVSATEDSRETTVLDILPDALKRPGLFPAGRLDKTTTGFCLITNDGAFAHRILAPAHHVTKTYLVRLRDALDYPAARLAFQNGIVLADATVLLSAELFPEPDGQYRVEIHEGRYHQIRRMFASLGNEVVELKRTAIGGLPLDETLQPGEARPLTADELARITGSPAEDCTK